jgi:hypothetical protein
MKIDLDFSEIKSMVNRRQIDDEVTEEMEDTITAIFVDLTSSAPVGTPVDTGVARNGWQIDLSDPHHPEVYNSVPYIGALNRGHSKKSPAGFVEKIIDKHTR